MERNMGTTREQAKNRVQLWLAVSGLLKDKRPNYGNAGALANLIWKLTDHQEVYTCGFIYDVWKELTL